MQKLPSHLYGESIFTTTRSLEGTAIFKDEHINRLLEQVNDYYFFNTKTLGDLEAYFNARENLKQFASQHPNHAIRLSVFSNSRSELVPKNFSLSDLSMVLTAKELTQKKAQSLKTMPTPYSSHKANLKAGSYFQNFYFKRQAFRAGFDDVLFYNSKTVTEASSSNIIFADDQGLYTPNDPSIFQGLGLEVLKNSGIKISKRSIGRENLNNFDSCYLVNAVHLLTPVARIDEYTFTNSQINPMLTKIDLFLRSVL